MKKITMARANAATPTTLPPTPAATAVMELEGESVAGVLEEVGFAAVAVEIEDSVGVGVGVGVDVTIGIEKDNGISCAHIHV